MTGLNYVVAQMNPVVGDLQANADYICNAAAQHNNEPNTLVVFPELAITGYPPEDLLTRPAFIEAAMHALQHIITASRQWQCSVLVGGVWHHDGLVYNAAMLISGGELRHVHKKNSLPNYSVFDERRYFAQGSAPVVYEHAGVRLGILVCEDAWCEHNFQLLKSQRAEMVVVLNASPFDIHKHTLRADYFTPMVKLHSLPLLYVNMVGAQDDLVFDGASFLMDSTGQIRWQLPAFEAVTASVSSHGVSDHAIAAYPSGYERMWKAIGLGLGDYIRKNRLSRVVIGLSGGMDSAMVAALAADMLGPKQVYAISLPSAYTSDLSNNDAAQLAARLGIHYALTPIQPFVDAAQGDLMPQLAAFGVNVESWPSQLLLGGNLQARIRASVLMAYANGLGAVLLNTSNKSEIAVGYSTLYGDSCGAYSPLKDVYKSEVYALAHWRNERGEIFSESILSKEPTAELTPGQKDSDQLPPYPVLDRLLHQLIEEKMSVQQIIASGADAQLAQKIYAMLRLSEYKRRQFAPGPKVSSMLFGKDWRYPLTNRFPG